MLAAVESGGLADCRHNDDEASQRFGRVDVKRWGVLIRKTGITAKRPRTIFSTLNT